MKVTRRALARIATAASAAVAVSGHAQSQQASPAPGNCAEPTPASRQLDKVKLPRETQPATRFEA